MTTTYTCPTCEHVAYALEDTCAHQREELLRLLDEMQAAPTTDYDLETIQREYGEWAIAHPEEALNLHTVLTEKVHEALRRVRFPRSQSPCPDDGRCYHDCVDVCWRVFNAGPLSHVFPDDRWPSDAR